MDVRNAVIAQVNFNPAKVKCYIGNTEINPSTKVTEEDVLKFYSIEKGKFAESYTINEKSRTPMYNNFKGCVSGIQVKSEYISAGYMNFVFNTRDALKTTIVLDENSPAIKVVEYGRREEDAKEYTTGTIEVYEGDTLTFYNDDFTKKLDGCSVNGTTVGGNPLSRVYGGNLRKENDNLVLYCNSSLKIQSTGDTQGFTINK